jgi:hypothetical protein
MNIVTEPIRTPILPSLDEGRRIECEHCKGVGWYETDQKLESGNGWDEPYEWEWAEADCEVCGGTGWAP